MKASGELPTTVRAVIGRFGATYQLSPREAAVVSLAAGGLSRKQSADQLGCSVATLDTHWRRIFKKTGFSCRTELFAGLLCFAINDRQRDRMRSSG